MIDLHVHTTYSDGVYTPEEIIQIAREKNIKTISFCDHNSIKLYDNFISPDDIEIIKGVEFYASKDRVSGLFHLLGYDFIPNENFLSIMKYLDQKRKESMIFKLYYIKKEFGIDIPIEALDQTWISEKNVREYLSLNYDEDYINNILDFVKGLKIKTTKKLDYRHIISLIRESNGIPVLAHPKSIICGDFELFLKDLIDQGLMGIEVYHSTHTEQDINKFLYFAEKYKLLVSGGSDYHGDDHVNSLGNIVELGNSNISKGIDDASILGFIRGRK